MPKHRESIFIITGVLLLVVIVGVVIYSMNFLVKNARDVSGQEPLKNQNLLRLNLEGLKKLGIMK